MIAWLLCKNGVSDEMTMYVSTEMYTKTYFALIFLQSCSSFAEYQLLR